MNNKKILIAFGTRPEAIKMCPLVRELKEREGVHISVCLTGQHRDLLDSAVRIFDVTPDYNLSVMRRDQTPTLVVSDILAEAEKIFDRARPDIVVVHGDTASALAVSLAAFFAGIDVAHVEAGLRSGDIYAPFPEEFNRRSISMTAALHFAPTENAATNLLNEGISPSRVFVTGNTVIDALRYTVKDGYSHKLLDDKQNNRIIFMTAHRRESHGDTMLGMFRAIRRICTQYPDVHVIFPVHPNPAVRCAANGILGECEGVTLCEPLDVIDCHNIMAQSYLILTDSGGIQEESAALGKPVLVMRNVTERPEGIKAGISRLAGTDEEQIFVTVKAILESDKLYKNMCNSPNPYGDGRACERIADILESKIFI